MSYEPPAWNSVDFTMGGGAGGDVVIYTAFEDLTVECEASSHALQSIPLEMEVSGGLIFKDVPFELEIASTWFGNIMLEIDVANPLLFMDISLDLFLTDGWVCFDIPLEMNVSSRAPSFVSVIAQRISSVVLEVE